MRVSVRDGNGICTKDHGNPCKKLLCAIALCGIVPVNPGNTGVLFCILGTVSCRLPGWWLTFFNQGLPEEIRKKSALHWVQIITPHSYVFTHDC